MDGGAFRGAGFRLPDCLQSLADAQCWVGWRWEEVKGRRTKPPVRIVDGRAAGRARNNRPEDWVTLDEAERALAAGGLDGVGLQLLDLTGFAAIDLDDVRDETSGALLPWVRDLVPQAASYAELTPSGRGLRILGAVAADFPATHATERRHPGGGKFEIYANLSTGRYITVTGARLAEAPDRLAPLDGLLGELLAVGPGRGPRDAAGSDPPSDVADAFAALPEPLRDTISHGRSGDRSADFQSAVNGLRAQVAEDVALAILRAHPGGPAGKYEGRLEAEFARSWRKAGQGGRRLGAPHAPEADVSEDGVARLLVDRHGARLRFDNDIGAWFEWNGGRWRRDATRSTLDAVREIAREISDGLPERQRVSARRATFVRGAEALARADPRVSVRQDLWDRDAFRLGVPDGVVDLRSGRLLPADPADFITRQAAAAPSEEARCPRWREFLDQTTGGDAGLAAYLQRLAGYALAGDTREHVLVFIHGPGGNGKSVFLNILAGILGDYAATASMDAFSASTSDRHPTDLAMLRGARLVTASETEEGRAWAESRIKQLTGGDPITARFMRQDFFTYRPQFKLVIVGNHKPVLRNVDDAARRRFHIVPFTHRPARPDPRLEEALRAEQAGILRWAVEGGLAWQAGGLQPPQAVLAETEAYFGAQDLIGQWLEDNCIVDPGNAGRWEPVGTLFADWRAYAEAAGERPGPQKSFGESLDRRGFPSGKKKPGGAQVRVRVGLSLGAKEAAHAGGDAWGREG